MNKITILRYKGYEMMHRIGHSGRALLKQKGPKKRMVVFIDEMSWMDTPRAKFLTAVEAFWNGWGGSQDNLIYPLLLIHQNDRKITY